MQEMTYTCPMHPEIRQEKPGMCPECGMNLVPEKQKKEASHGGHDKHAGHSTALFFRKFWISLALTIPVVLYADVIEKTFKWSALHICRLRSVRSYSFTADWCLLPELGENYGHGYLA